LNHHFILILEEPFILVDDVPSRVLYCVLIDYFTFYLVDLVIYITL